MKIIALLSAVAGLAFGVATTVSTVANCGTCLGGASKKACAKTSDLSMEFTATKCCASGDTDMECTSDDYSCASGTTPLSYRYCMQPTECGDKDYYDFGKGGDKFDFKGTSVTGTQCAFQIGFPKYKSDTEGAKYTFDITADKGVKTDFEATVEYYDGKTWEPLKTLEVDAMVSVEVDIKGNP